MSRISRNTVIRVCATLIAAIAAVLSFSSMRLLLLDWGMDTASAAAIPLTVDLLAIICTFGVHSPRATRGEIRAAYLVLAIAGSVSLAANALAGHSFGSRVAHVWCVIAYLLAEYLANKFGSKKTGAEDPAVTALRDQVAALVDEVAGLHAALTAAHGEVDQARPTPRRSRPRPRRPCAPSVARRPSCARPPRPRSPPWRRSTPPRPCPPRPARHPTAPPSWPPRATPTGSRTTEARAAVPPGRTGQDSQRPPAVRPGRRVALTHTIL